MQNLTTQIIKTDSTELIKILNTKKEVLISRLKLNQMEVSFEDYANDIIYTVENSKGEKGDLSQCDANSIFNSAMQLAKVGLSIGGNIGFLVKYGTKCTFQIGFEGYAVILNRYCNILMKKYDIIYKDDKFEYNNIEKTENGILKIKAHYSLDRKHNNKNKESIIGAYSYILMSDGNSFIDYKTTKELDRFRQEWDSNTKTFILKKGNFWNNWTEIMYAKQIAKIQYRNLCKMYCNTNPNILEVLSNEENNELKNEDYKENNQITQTTNIEYSYFDTLKSDIIDYDNIEKLNNIIIDNEKLNDNEKIQIENIIKNKKEFLSNGGLFKENC